MRLVIPENDLDTNYVSTPTNTMFRRASTGTYVDYRGNILTAGSNVIRYNFNKSTREFEGVLIEPRRLNLLLNSTTSGVSSQSVTVPVSATAFVLSFYGSGSVTVSTSGFTHTLNGRGTNERVWRVYSNARASRVFSISVSGQVYAANLEPLDPNDDIAVETGTADQREAAWNASDRFGVGPTSFIPTGASAVYREADELSDLPSDWYSNSTPRFAVVHSTFNAENVSAYDELTDYNTGDRVSYQNYVYESVMVDINAANTPSENPDKWLKIRPINNLAMFNFNGDYRSIVDNSGFATIIVNNKTDLRALSTFETLVIDRGTTGAGLLGSNAEYAAIAGSKVWRDIRQGEGDNRGWTPAVYKTGASSGFLKTDERDKYFLTGNSSAITPSRGERNIAVSKIDVNVISIYVSSSPIGVVPRNEELYVSKFVAGHSNDIGRLKNGVTASIIDFSSKEVDQFGYATLIKRGFSKTLDCPVRLTKDDYNRVMPLLYSVRSQPILWVPSEEDYVSNLFILLGFYRDLGLVIDYCDAGLYNIRIEGIVWDSPGSLPVVDDIVFAGGQF